MFVVAVMDCHNVSKLGEVAGIEAQMFSFAQNFTRRTAVDFSTEPAMELNCCYAQAFDLSIVCKKQALPYF
jgi:hypothetical protein